MASAPTTKIGNGQLPTGFVSPFKRVPMQGTHDDMLACAATLCGKSLDDVKKMAVTLGMRANGPFYMDESLFRKILFNLSDLTCSDYKDFAKVDALPNVAVLCGAFSKFDESCRHVVFHHVKGTDKFTSFSYLLDPAPWVDSKFYITTDFSEFKLEPQAWYMEITQRPNPSGKSK